MSTAVVVVAVLAVGTYALRLGGVVLADRLTPEPAPSSGPAPPRRPLPEPVRRLLPLAAVALLAALAATAALTEAGEFAGVARPAGVLVGVALAWRRLPFAVVVIAAAVTAAGLRLLGVP